MQTKKALKFFSIFEYEKEQDYLRNMHKSGWKFVCISGFCVYHFEKCEPEDVIYQLDYNQEGIAHKDQYIKMFEDCGWEYLQDYVTNDEIENLGTIKEADMEAVMACEPDVIFIGGRLSSSYDALSEIAPVVYLATDTEAGVVESVRKNASTIASMFDLEENVDTLMADFDERIQTLSDFADGKTAIIGMCTSGSFNVLGNDGRCSIIGVEIGFENVGVDADVDTSTHGNEVSFEYIVDKNPDYIFVMDRDAAIGTDGAKLAQEIMENELVMSTEAYKNGNIVYLAHPAVWYTAEGGITALDLMLQDLESELLL